MHKELLLQQREVIMKVYLFDTQSGLHEGESFEKAGMLQPEETRS
jgi:hypothetical protein